MSQESKGEIYVYEFILGTPSNLVPIGPTVVLIVSPNMRCGVFVDTNLGINRSRSPDIDGVITMRRSGAGRGPNSEYLVSSLHF